MKTYIVYYKYVKYPYTCFFCPCFTIGCPDKYQESNYSINKTKKYKSIVIRRIKPNPVTFCRMKEVGEGWRQIVLENEYESENQLIDIIKDQTKSLTVDIVNIVEVL